MASTSKEEGDPRLLLEIPESVFDNILYYLEAEEITSLKSTSNGVKQRIKEPSTASTSKGEGDPRLLMEIPEVVFEKILRYLEAEEITLFKTTSKGVKQRIKEAELFIGVQQIYLRAVQPERGTRTNAIVKQLFASHMDKLEPSTRKEDEKELKLFRPHLFISSAPGPNWPGFQPSQLADKYVDYWSEVYYWSKTYLGKLSRLPMRMELMRDTERILKDQFHLFYGLLWEDTVPDEQRIWPMQFISTCGPILYHFMGPNRNISNPEHITFYENMVEPRRVELKAMIPREPTNDQPEAFDVVYSCKTMIFTFPLETPVLILQLTEAKGVWLCPVHEGRSLRLSATFNRDEYPTATRIPTPYAVCGHYVAVFENPIRISVHRISVDKNGDLASELVMPYSWQHLHTMWSRIARAKDSYFFGLSHDMDMPEWTSERDTIPNVKNPEAYYFTLFTLTHSIKFRVTWEEGKTFIYGRELLEKLGDHPTFSYDYCTLVIWSAKAFAMPQGAGAICIGEWKSLAKVVEDVSLLEIIDNGTIMICGDWTRIVLGKVKVVTKPTEKDEFYGEVSFEVVRVIRIPILGLLDQEKEITRFHFDFDHGRPYIFFILEQRDLPYVPPPPVYREKLATGFRRYWVLHTPPPPPPPRAHSEWRFTEKYKGKGQFPASTYLSMTYELYKITFDVMDEWNSDACEVKPNPLAASAFGSSSSAASATEENAEFPDEMLTELLKCLEE